MSLEDLIRKAKASSNHQRALAFVELFQFFLERYQSELDSKSPREIDYNDMISSATQYVQKRRFTAPWKYIIVDEFQDISVGRYLLLEALLKSRDNLKLFAVGDDWQSIYRFAGSDIAIMSKFRKFFGRATIVKLDQTFRFNDRIASVSGKFIQKNPRQIQKNLTTKVQCTSPQVFLHELPPNIGSQRLDKETLEKVIGAIKENVQQDNPTLLILSRYNRLLPDRYALRALESIWPGQIKTPLTIHKSKGLEADYVIIHGLTANMFGFPAEISDDPLLNLVLAQPESYCCISRHVRAG